MPLPIHFLLQEGKVKGLEESWKTEHDEAMRAGDWEEVVKVFHTTAVEAEQFWKILWADLNKGERQDFETLGRFVDRFFTRVTELLTDVKEQVGQFARGTGHAIAGLEDLEQATNDLKDLHGRIMANWPWKKRDWPVLNKSMQQRSRSHADGPGEDVEDIIRRLNAGESVI